jgi:hypothetical protein
MDALDEVTDKVRRNTRGQFDQRVKNPQCEMKFWGTEFDRTVISR